MDKINLKPEDIRPRDEKNFPYHDLIREGRNPVLDPIRVAGVMRVLIEKVNELIDEWERMRKRRR